MTYGGEVEIYNTAEVNVTEDFQSAVEFIGEDWLKRNHADYYGEESPQHFSNDNIPVLVKWYHAAKNVLSGEDKTTTFGFELNESALRFLELGAAIEEIKDSAITTRSGEVTDNSLVDLYRNEVQKTDSNVEEHIHELIVAAWYSKSGNEVAILDEGESEGKCPDFRITNATPNVDIEHKRVRKQNHKEQKISHNLDRLVTDLAESIEASFAAFIETEDITPEKINRSIGSVEISSLSEYKKVSAPIGDIHIYPLQSEFPFRIHQKVISEYSILPSVNQLIVKPDIDSIDKIDTEEIGFETTRFTAAEGDVGLIGSCAWIGIDNITDHSAAIKRAKNQFSGVSGKFSEERPAIIHIDVPSYSQLTPKQRDDMKQSLKLELIEPNRADISAVILNSKRYSKTDESWTVRTEIKPIPHYNHYNELPDDLDIFGIDLEQEVDHHQFIDETEEIRTENTENAIQSGLESYPIGILSTIWTNSIFSSSQSAIVSESEDRALIFGSSDGSGKISFIDINEGWFKADIPTKYSELERVFLNINITRESGLHVFVSPYRRDIELDSTSVELEKPIKSEQEVTKETIRSIQQ